MERDVKEGDKVHYKKHDGSFENGIVKSIDDPYNIAFVVYKCNDEWENYRDYTGCATNITDLSFGWK